MKSAYAYRDRGKTKITFTEEELEKYFLNQLEKYRSELYDEVKQDVAAQVLATIFFTMEKNYGWKRKRLLKLKEEIESSFKLMKHGVMGKPFTPVDCIYYLKSHFGIDLDKNGGGYSDNDAR